MLLALAKLNSAGLVLNWFA